MMQFGGREAHDQRYLLVERVKPRLGSKKRVVLFATCRVAKLARHEKARSRTLRRLRERGLEGRSGDAEGGDDDLDPLKS